jgi:hypothetical protein
VAWALPEDDDGAPLPELAPEVPERDDPDVAAGVGVPDVPELLVLAWIEPGSTPASTPEAAALAIPIPAVSADSRRSPRRLRNPGVTWRLGGWTGIRFPFCRRPAVTNPGR